MHLLQAKEFAIEADKMKEEIKKLKMMLGESEREKGALASHFEQV